ncbi:MAG: hypothetical protein K2Q26_05075 [Bdellovibrionales bacterium]|nr:hypothetical protein [Bdellovibrionales bacterium]
MSKLFCFSFFIVIAFSVSADDVKRTVWIGEMKNLSAALEDILPEVFKPDPKTPREIAELKSKANKLYEVSKKIDLGSAHGVKSPEDDPSLAFISESFRDQIALVNNGMQNGFYSYSKSQLGSAISYCIACHTRDSTGTQLPFVSALSKAMISGSWIDKVRLEASLRHFDSAYHKVMIKLKNPDVLRTHKTGLEPAINIALMIAVRVKKSPEHALLICKKIRETDHLNTALKDKAIIWENDIRKWQKEGPFEFTTEDQLLKKVKRLIGLNDDNTHRVVYTGEVNYLIATELMHTYFKRFPKPENLAEALYITGLCYEAINEMTFWDIHEKYYEKCLKTKPKSAIGLRCFKAYKESVELGYTGSGGKRLPYLVEEKLKSLEKMVIP